MTRPSVSPPVAQIEIPHRHAGAIAGGVTLLVQHEEGEISVLETARADLEARQAAGEKIRLDLTFVPELAAHIARCVLTGHREGYAGVNGAARILAAMVIAQNAGTGGPEAAAAAKEGNT